MVNGVRTFNHLIMNLVLIIGKWFAELLLFHLAEIFAIALPSTSKIKPPFAPFVSSPRNVRNDSICSLLFSFFIQRVIIHIHLMLWRYVCDGRYVDIQERKELRICFQEETLSVAPLKRN